MTGTGAGYSDERGLGSGVGAGQGAGAFLSTLSSLLVLSGPSNVDAVWYEGRGSLGKAC